jgi:hypothetical protein
MEPKFRKYYLEWWRIRKSTIWGIVALIIISAGLGLGSWWAIQYDWFAPKDLSEIPRDAARIISFEGDVRITRSGTRETIVVTRETHAAPGDTIQTQSDGRATVEMIDGSVYTVRPNSTVVIRDNSSLFGGRNIRVALDDGQLNVRTDVQAENAENVVEMLDSETRLRSQTDASFNADPRTKGGEIRISRGSVETTVGGKRTTINENEFAALREGRISQKEHLLLPPRLLSPVNTGQIMDNSGVGANVTFSWTDDGGVPVANYQLQISRSPTFASAGILVDRTGLTARDFRLSSMLPGTYYWRVKAAARSGQISDWSEPSRFSVVRKESAHTIEVKQWNVEKVGGNVFIVSGTTRPGLLVRFQDREVFSGGDGSFRLQISTSQSEVPIDISDDRGNRSGFVVSLQSARVVRRF